MLILELKKFAVAFGVMTLALSTASLAAAPVPAAAASAPSGNVNIGVIKGVVRGDSGPIADATVAIFRLGTSKLLKQVQSAADGSFIARVLPGTYTVLAVAQGYNPTTLSAVEVSSNAPLTYGFQLERAGSGNTLPEKRLDRNNPKWVIRSAQTSRSIYQNSEGEAPAETVAESVDAADEDPAPAPGKIRGVVETYFAGPGSYPGLNFATLIPVNANTELVFAGQTGTGDAPQRFETQLRFNAGDDHKIRLNASASRLGRIGGAGDGPTLGQISFQAADEWQIREGVILVFGVDYAKFVGAGSDFSISPRIGFQYDLDAKTRFRTSFAPRTETRTWSQALDLEDAGISFREPVAIDDIVIEEGAPRMNRSNRLEFGVERVLDGRSSIETTFFLDTTLARGVGFTTMPFGALDPSAFGDVVGNQKGSSQGMRLVYARRLSGRLSAAAGYSFGRGQKLSAEAVTNPAALFQNDLFQTFYGQLEADLKTGTNLKTVFRLSPDATVFAIDPFQGRLAIYDPGLSILVTQNLPTLGLPFHAQAVVDARNIFDFQTGVSGDEGSLRLSGQRRMLRGGILVRF